MKRKLQIFISSTYKDLKEERQAAVEAILKAGHIPAGMELFAAGDKSQFEIIKKWIDESDIFLLILGGRYGSIEESTGKSYTHLEYEYAESVKKPLFAIVPRQAAIDNKVAKIGYQEAVELQEPHKYEQFKKHVSDKMVSFYNDIKDIKIEIPASIDYLKSNYEFQGWVSGKELIKMESELLELKRELQNLKKNGPREETTLKAERKINYKSSGDFKPNRRENIEKILIQVVDKFNAPLQFSQVLLYKLPDVIFYAETSARGECYFSLQELGHISTYSIYAAHSTCKSFWLENFNIKDDIKISLKENSLGGSAIVKNTASFPNLNGVITISLNDNNKFVVEATDISIEDGKIQPVEFNIGQKLSFIDMQENMLEIKINRIFFLQNTNDIYALVDYEQPFHQAFRPTITTRGMLP